MKKHAGDFAAKLVKKYPEYSWVEKYVDAEMAHVIPMVSAISVHYLHKLGTMWTHEATLSDLIKIIDFGKPISWTIKLKNGIQHSVVVKGYDLERRIFIVNDPLGDYNSNYFWVNGESVELTETVMSSNMKNNANFLHVFYLNHDERQFYVKLFKGRHVYHYP